MPDPALRHTWLVALHRSSHTGGAALSRTAMRDLLRQAATWRDWPLVLAIGAHLAATGGLDTHETLHLVDACRTLGQAEQALALVRGLGAADLPPGRAGLEAEIQSWRAWRRRFPALAPTAELALEPLAHHHERDFAWQYHDPAIASLCCLPVFIDALDWHHWLADTWRDGHRLPYAVLHREWGFIGCVSLALHRDLGFFYYWLGRDFQGHGVGPRAGQLLLAMGERAFGLRCCYAKAFDYNLRSRRGLEKMGFVDLGMRGAGDDRNQVFYRRGPAQGRARTVDELHRLLDSMDASVRPPRAAALAT